MSTQPHLKKYLKNLITENPFSLKAEVAKEALECQDIRCFFTDLLQHGCASGMVGSLIYYSDTRAFYDKYYDEIENIRYELEDALDEPLQPQGDLKNWYAWLAFEETARGIADILKIEW